MIKFKLALFQLILLCTVLASCHVSKKQAPSGESQQETVQNAYNNLVKEADLYFFESKWLKARDKYRDAYAVKPNEEYPANQLRIIEGILAGEE